jgi:hypothetical protein
VLQGIQNDPVSTPLMIEAASVQWVSGQSFGPAFFRISQTEQQ